MLKAIAKLVAALNGNTGKGQIAAGFSWGMVLGLVPAGNFFWAALLVVSFLFRHHHGGKVFVLAVLKLLSPLLSPLVIDPLGWEVLHIGALQNFYTVLYNTPFVVFTQFNNTLVAGGLAAALGLFIPVYAAAYFLVPLYRNTLLPKIARTGLVRAISRIPVVTKLAKLTAAFQGDVG